MGTSLTWRDVLSSEKHQPYLVNMFKLIEKERMSGFTVYPPKKDIFNAFKLTELNNVKVVILGQDPYHGPNQAHGLAFSVNLGIDIPPSLLNIYKELERSVIGFKKPNHGCLNSWARQGVLLLNSILTVRAGQAYSHANLGWEILTNKVVSLINEYCDKVVFLLWGFQAQKKLIMLNKQRHYCLQASHPSPLSAHYSFLGCNHFVLVNKWLNKHKKKAINWMSISSNYS